MLEQQTGLTLSPTKDNSGKYATDLHTLLRYVTQLQVLGRHSNKVNQ